MQGAARFIVVSGLPGSGKSTLARPLGRTLDLQVLDKDDFVEASFADHDVIDAAVRQRLSRLACDALREHALAAKAAILVSFWRREQISATSGTPTDWLAQLPNLVEVHCECPPLLAAERFRARLRHLGHRDHDRPLDQLVGQFEALATLGPLGIGRLVVVRTDEPVAIPDVAERIRSSA